MAAMSPELRADAWMQLANHPSTEGLKSIATPYSTQAGASLAPNDDILTPLAALLQCRLDVQSITEELGRAESWAALNSSQTQFSQLRTRFRTSMKRLSGGTLSRSLKIKTGDVPFGKVQWEKTYAGSSTSGDSDGDQTMTDESDDSPEELSDDEDDDDYESDSEGDEEDCMDESSKKPRDCGLDEVSGPRLQRTRQMHVLHNTVTLCRLARVIASVEQRGAELLAKDLNNTACAGDKKAKILAQLQHAADEARASWAKEMQRELEVAEQYRIAMIQVLQDELRR